MGKIIELGKGHSINDDPLIHIGVDEEGNDIHTERTYDAISRPETQEEESARMAAHEEISKTQWVSKRQTSYPSSGEGLDAFWHYLNDCFTPEQIAKLPQATQDWYNSCAAVKKDIPKTT